MAGLFLLDYGFDKRSQLLVGSAALHLAGEVVIKEGKEAGADLSIGGQAHAAAVSAERMRHGRDDADLAHAIVELIPPGGLAVGMRNLDQRAKRLHALQDFIERDHDLRRPDAVLF